MSNDITYSSVRSMSLLPTLIASTDADSRVLLICLLPLLVRKLEQYNKKSVNKRKIETISPSFHAPSSPHLTIVFLSSLLISPTNACGRKKEALLPTRHHRFLHNSLHYSHSIYPTCTITTVKWCQMT